ncbi:cysteine-rich receptor-like protein kinase 6 isoform X2 [Brachypodium distachyon]|uniref:cysteine-rich receptor-like protein kinase 6 isoform X2 n=1 Tax=Brachypodium distachyon TaxID=15368 RepID=UPI0005300BFF|nr:cysteine-rich receptor-like protein kinase 6 isoform X2 [Brachypodium distachyon]|eukprot:XP_010227708.1 cysteine-rich receptor-like protein kinase 6 isoform X2 [Brachypodium distachyon]
MSSLVDVCAAAVVLLLSLSSLLPSAGAVLFDWSCSNGTSYAENSTYQSNVRSLLSSLAANATRVSPVGFSTAIVGASPDKVWGLGLCRGDTNGTACASCLAQAPAVAFGQGDYCMGVKDASIFYDRCLVRYSSKDFLSTPDLTSQAQSTGVGDVSVVPGSGSAFTALVASLVTALSDWAAFNTTSRYAVGAMVSDRGFLATTREVVHRINGMVQCTPDQAPGACRGCLGALIDDMPAFFNGSVGGQVLGVWCSLRFEIFEFYDGGPMLELVAPQPTPPPPPSAVSKDGTGGNGTRWGQHPGTIAAIVLGVAVILLSISMVLLWRNAGKQPSYQEDDDPASLLFDLPTLRRATDNFAEENMLGHGGFGAVYKGLLPHGQQIAVKRLDKASGQGLKELRNELLLMAKLRHNNLTKLLGVCLKGEEKLLVYEYLPNRSLDTFLFAPEIEKRLLLHWEIRYRIIYGTARGLVYLHEDSQIKIIHRDLKAGNVLLDTNMNPKISDFGLARLFNGERTTAMTSQVVGTLGYMAPEYAVLGHISVKLDVYSFGVLVLEVVTGRKSTDFFESAVDESSTLLSYENPADRPSMLDVVVMLHGDDASSFAAPSKPAFTFGYCEQSSESVSAGDPPGTKTTADLHVPSSVNGMSVSEFKPR